MRDIAGGPNQVRIFDLDGKPEGKLPLPEIAANAEIEPLADGDVLFDVSTYLEPRYYASWSPRPARREETELKVISPVSFADAEVVRAFATSKDGTRMPLNIIDEEGFVRDGKIRAALWLWRLRYQQEPRFPRRVRRIWLDARRHLCHRQHPRRRRIWRTWHQEALTQKQNVFDDFAAAGELSDHSHYTSHESSGSWAAPMAGC